MCGDTKQPLVEIARPENVGREAKILVSALYTIQLLSVLRKHIVLGRFSFVFLFFQFFFLCFLLVTINRQTSYGSGILRED